MKLQKRASWNYLCGSLLFVIFGGWHWIFPTMPYAVWVYLPLYFIHPTQISTQHFFLHHILLSRMWWMTATIHKSGSSFVEGVWQSKRTRVSMTFTLQGKKTIATGDNGIFANMTHLSLPHCRSLNLSMRYSGLGQRGACQSLDAMLRGAPPIVFFPVFSFLFFPVFFWERVGYWKQWWTMLDTFALDKVFTEWLILLI